ncbi:MAG TPA: hypothetical protein VM049_08795 [Gaiellaceae bacterium]|nr:hypothetical protein [Gaiellaceae bacterium]
MRFLLALASALALAVPAAAGPPNAGVLVPGRSLGGVRLGASEEHVERLWGRAYGVCSGCATKTWYFNYFAFQPRGVGVELRQGRVVAAFTIYQPPGWRTTRGLLLGDSVARVTSVYGALVRRECGTYAVLVLPGRGVTTAFYVLEDQVWAFALLRPGLPLCR